VADIEITVEQIAAAEALFGIACTGAERAQMCGNLGPQIERAQRRRAVDLPHDLAPATRFDPRLPGFVMPAQPFLAWPLDHPGALPDDEAGIAFAPVWRLAFWIAARAISAERLTTIYLDRIARHAPALECFAAVAAEPALVQARRADTLLASGTHLGPLHGIPYGCKDLLDTEGIATEWGAEPFAGRVPAADATVVRRLAEAGAVLLGKTTLGALAYGDIWNRGVTRNPWNLREGSSGSSAGSAAATAAGLVGFAIGTETFGSIVAPSLRCGTTGLRPTFGRVPRTGAMPLCWSLDKIGPICRSVADTALVLAAINGFDAADPSSIAAPFGVDARAPVEGLRLGYYPADFADERAHTLDHAALEAARAAGLELVPLTRPDLPYDALLSVLHAEAAASFEELTLSGADDTLTWQDADAWPNSFRKARFLSAVDHVQLDRLRRRVMQDMASAFAGVDAMIGPCIAGPMLIITNFTGHPCLVLRSGLRTSPPRPRLTLAKLAQATVEAEEEATVPHAICLYGRLFEEGTILRIGAALESRFAVAERRPELFAA
jgi:Asp-tRNA(Asn)/Glu-tRNA(Gln) amidotransferase A subunit family amidase